MVCSSPHPVTLIAPEEPPVEQGCLLGHPAGATCLGHQGTGPPKPTHSLGYV